MYGGAEGLDADHPVALFFSKIGKIEFIGVQRQGIQSQEDDVRGSSPRI